MLGGHLHELDAGDGLDHITPRLVDVRAAADEFLSIFIGRPATSQGRMRALSTSSRIWMTFMSSL